MGSHSTCVGGYLCVLGYSGAHGKGQIALELRNIYVLFEFGVGLGE